jgi:tRNA A-37 threonylcarbamoyl transferase component Bud32
VLRDLSTLRQTWIPLSGKANSSRALARLINKLHRTGVAHRDLKATNFIVRGSQAVGYKLYIVDFDGIDLGVFPEQENKTSRA